MRSIFLHVKCGFNCPYGNQSVYILIGIEVCMYLQYIYS